MKLDLANPAWQQTLPSARSLATDAPVAACAFSHDGSTVAFALGDGQVRLLPADIAAPTPTAAAPLHGGAVLALIADPAGDGFVSGGDDGRVLRIAPDGSATELLAQKGKWVEHLAAHRNGAVAIGVGRTMFVAKDGEVREFGPHQSTVAGLDFSKDGSRVACAHYGGITVWSIGQVILPPRKLAWRGSHVALKWSTDGKFIATGTQENDIHVWRVAQATDMRMQGYPAKVKSLSWTADARFLYTSAQPVFTAWPFSGKGPEGKPPLQFGDEGAGLITVVAAHPAAEFVAGGYDSGELQLGDIKAKRSVVLKMADSSAITCLAWAPDGFRLAVGNERGDLQVIDLKR
ncbi:MAG: WD40 repeat domain-containing protein [Reyranella sp.]|uniref:WD40 repeat domain-containing protein n=1 Tax=Reyranella sp. TaxID=1929291 RepID=UPI000A9C54A4|nr:WD40 repeat domain-containing protein [Reyranella sp.]MBR2815986.1 WD40 repeat domain-containing protein [Reyranella sp.]